MPITPEQREARKKYIGSSDAAAIVGLSPFANAADVYYSKVEDIQKEETAAMSEGTRLEPVVLDWAATQICGPGEKFSMLRDQFRTMPPYACANHDALIVGAAQGVEAKTTGIVGPAFGDWGEEGTDEVPEHVIIQCQHQMMVSALELVWVPVLIGGQGFKMYRVVRNDDLIHSLIVRLAEFWEEHVVKRVPPEVVPHDTSILRRLRREPNKVVSIPGTIVSNWLDAKAAAAEAAKAKEIAEAVLLTCLGDAEAGDSEAGRVTFYEQTRKGYTVEDKTYRVLRLPKGRLLNGNRTGDQPYQITDRASGPEDQVGAGETH